MLLLAMIRDLSYKTILAALFLMLRLSYLYDKSKLAIEQ